MAKRIHIGELSIPLDNFVVARTAALGITRSGKTYAAKGIAEQLLDADVPIVVFDAIGVWRYLKTPGDGPNAKGYPVVVAGGAKPDLPLTPTSAPEIVRAAIRENIPLVIDLYDAKLSKADWRRIVQACFRTLLYENKGLRHVFLEEAAEYAPQKIMDGETYAEVEKLARMGGNVHVGITFINQRAQELNKAVLELCDNLILLRQRGSHAIDSLEKWMDRISPDTAREIGKALPHMTQGECWVWTEDREQPVLTRTRQLRSLHPDRRTPGESLPSRPAVDTARFVARLTGELHELVERAKADDPKELKRRIATLEQELKAKPVAPAAEVKTVEVPVLNEKAVFAVEKLLARADSYVEKLFQRSGELVDHAKDIREAIEPLKKSLDAATTNVPPVTAARAVPCPPPTTPRAPVTASGDYRERVLRAIATLMSRGIPANQRSVAAWLRVHRNNGSLCAALASLRADGTLSSWTVQNGGEREPLIHDGPGAVETMLEPFERRVVEALQAQALPSQAALADFLGVHRNNGSLCGALAHLRKMGLLSARGIELTEALYR